MKVYIACGFKDRALYAEIKEVCDRLGLSITFNWTEDPPPSDPVERLEYRRINATREIEGVQAADLLIVGLPGGYGTASELGAALASEVPVILYGKVTYVGSDPINIFLDHPGVTGQVTSPVGLELLLAAKIRDRTGEEMAEHLRMLDLECSEKLSPPAFAADRKRLIGAWDKATSL